MADVLMLLSDHRGDGAHENSSREGVARPVGRFFECKTCNRRFPTFQALGGHRTSHRKPKLPGVGLTNQGAHAKRKVHECSICGLEFAMGQALGGHMRRHKGEVDVEVSNTRWQRCTEKSSPQLTAGFLCLDLNLPPAEEDYDDVDFLRLGLEITPRRSSLLSAV